MTMRATTLTMEQIRPHDRPILDAIGTMLLHVSRTDQHTRPITCNLLRNLAAGETEMLEPTAIRILVHALLTGLFGWALSLAMITQASAAESLPANVRACTAETDRERRLDCFDREVARFQDSKATSQAARHQPAAPPGTPQPPAAAPTATTTPTGSATPAAPATPATQASAKADNAARPGRIAAQLISIDRAPNEMVLHLDNGQVWEEVQSVSGDLSLKAGDRVTIDRRLGSYWLTGPHVSGMKVRQRN